ncbi:glycosyltransferase 25 family member [Cylas formicarius]|uniref:glycosyltransferase 25 family member n=1 Tax=Cylas formicarius TaxID=197179 RepID=UPI00295854CB|nr:glycosyltransferase 25 family member [Cylas formicarius]
MRLIHIIIALSVFITSIAASLKNATVLIAVLVRNKEHTLPYFLSSLERLNYDKNRISLWIRSDHNFDKSIVILRTWIKSVKESYHSIYTEFEEGTSKFSDENNVAHWSNERFSHIISTRESALNHARHIWADFLLFIDADVFLTNRDTLNYLIKKNAIVVAPMLLSDGLYSNFWHGMDENYYYLRTDGYRPILNRDNVSCYEVPMVHSCVLINLRTAESDHLTYRPDKIPNYDGPNDDIIAFALSARHNNISLNVCNEEVFGYITAPMDQTDDVSYDYEQLRNILLKVVDSGEPLHLNDILAKFVRLPTKDTLQFDQIFMINLRRRTDRRKRMQYCFDVLGLDVSTVDAVDGRALNESFLESIAFMPEFFDPYHKRPMKLGEIGCFLSHYHIWQDVVDKKYESVLVLEDDIRFEPFFRFNVQNVMDEVNRIADWDLVYFGRKRLQDQHEPWHPGSNYLVEVGYSYWTLGYALSLRGAKKLLDADPLSKLVPVDEYLPIMFDKHPQESWKRHFPDRNLVAFSTAPLLLYPTHYTGEKGYVSDTEDSVVIPEVFVERFKDDL